MLLSIITITRDDREGLERTLASTADCLLNPEVEQIVIDGSTPAVLINRPRIRMVRQQPLGIAAAFNEGLRIARGEWVWFLNGGDRMDHRLQIEFLLSLLRLSTTDVIIGGMTNEGEHTLRPVPPPKMQWPPYRSWIPHPSTMIRRRLFERFGFFDERYTIAMDFEWWLRALSDDVPVDLLSLPFAIFAPGGVSLRPETQPIDRAETAHAVWRHRRILVRSWLGQTKLTFRELLRAWRQKSRE
jgi:GT2 family glycosyltransferase